MLELLTLLLLPVLAVVAIMTSVHAHRAFETPPSVIYVAALPIGLAQVLASFGAHGLLGGFLLAFRLSGVAIGLCGAFALLDVTWQLGGRGLQARAVNDTSRSES